MKKILSAIIVLFCVTGGSYAQAIQDNASVKADAPPPVKRIVIFSSGIAYYEHSGNVSGGVFTLPFKTNAVNDALKSLVINDPASTNPSVSYQGEQTLMRTLQSLSVDLSHQPDVAQILRNLRGAEVEIAAPSPTTGRILGIEFRQSAISPFGGEPETFLSLYTPQGLKLINLKEISSLQFKDPQINADFIRALDIIASSRQQQSRSLLVNLPGTSSRQVSLSYVIPSPVWKVSYRLDLGNSGTSAAGTSGKSSNAKPLFQGWAIVDNDSDTDWNNVSLSLVAGRPASFVQNLYPPYYLSRPTLPLAIAGTAAAEAHDASYGGSAYAENDSVMYMYDMAAEESAKMARSRSPMEYEVMEEAQYDRAPMPAPAYAAKPQASVTGGVMETTQGTAAGDQFEFTVKNPVSLERRMSVMLPLVEANIDARKTLIFSGANAIGRNMHPRLGAEITNTSGMKLPAGPITVYEDGTYAGDALLEFWNESEKRLISFGEDLAVTGSAMANSSRVVSTTTISGGVMTIGRNVVYERTYTFKNNAAQQKQLVLEHPKMGGASLTSPKSDEETPAAYRFNVTLPSQKETTFTVNETQPITERVTLLSLRLDSFLSYSTNQEIPQQVRNALQRAIELRRAVDTTTSAVAELQTQRDYLVSEQDRIRKNLEAAGSQTQQGQEYLKRLVALDSDIDKLGQNLESARTATKNAREAYENYLNGLNL